jgi:hypothetical protein
MAHHRPFFGRSPTSRTSLTSVGQMPVIDEDQEVRVSSKTPVTPLRSPQRSYRRSMARGLPPPYVPATHLPPVYRPPYLEAVERKKAAAADLEAGKDIKAGEVTKSRLRKYPTGKDPKPNSRWRSCRFITLLGVLMAIVVGLAVGLTIGLKDKYACSFSATEEHPWISLTMSVINPKTSPKQHPFNFLLDLSLSIPHFNGPQRGAHRTLQLGDATHTRRAPLQPFSGSSPRSTLIHSPFLQAITPSPPPSIT